MLRPLGTAFAALALLSGGAALAQPVAVLQYDELRDARLALAQMAGTVDGSGPVAYTFNSFGRLFSLALEPNAHVNEIARRLDPQRGVTAYRGTLAGRPGSWVRLVLSAYGPAGLIFDGERLYGIESPVDTDTSSTKTAIFRADDLYMEPGTLSCQSPSMPLSGSAALERLVAEVSPALAATVTLNIDIGVVADFEFTDSHSVDPVAALVTRINNVDGIFSEQLGVRMTITDTEVFETDTDPFTTSDANDLLFELSDYRGNTPAQRATGLTHLFTGRDLDGTTVGIAFAGAVCDPVYGAGLTQGTRGATTDSLIAAHEIGHNFGAPHDGDPSYTLYGCASTPETYLMAPLLSGSDQFSACSLGYINDEIDSILASPNSCLTEVPYADLDLTAAEPDASSLAGAAFDYRLTLRNLGSGSAPATSLAVTFGPGLTILSAAPASGNCGPVQPDMSCELGDIPGGASRDVVFRLQSNQLGSHSIEATAATTGEDANLGNNALADTVTVIPAVDLSLSAVPLRVEREQTVVLDVQLRNASSMTANAVELTATVTAGARPSAAALAGQNCAIDGQSVHCSVASLAPQDEAVLALSLVGIATGRQTVTLGVVADEPDTAPGDNNLVIAVDVFEPAAQSSSGGGGSIGILALLGLLAAGGARHGGSRPRRRR